ncbi:hypothetical protein BDW22DRAFT_1358033 [Trametopsis cervina]|nr:hypothetical protein BDW22DRAFT_1358033 [Trametopsis cervina]
MGSKSVQVCQRDFICILCSIAGRWGMLISLRFSAPSSVYGGVDSLQLGGPSKRRRTDGMNNRFDRMIATVNVMPSPELPRRRRANSSSKDSSSVASYFAPRTPVDAYNKLEGGRLGQDFSTMRARTSRSFDPTFFDDPPPENEESKVPDWLSDTFATLEPHHPIRALIPSKPAYTSVLEVTNHDAHVAQPRSPSVAYRSAPSPTEDVFAFRPPSTANSEARGSPLINNIGLQSSTNAFDMLPEYGHEIDGEPPEEVASPYPHQDARQYTHPDAHIPRFALSSPLSDDYDSISDVHNSLILSPGTYATPPPYSKPGPFVSHQSMALVRATPSVTTSSVYRPLSDAVSRSSSIVMSPDASLPFTTPGPLARPLPSPPPSNRLLPSNRLTSGPSPSVLDLDYMRLEDTELAHSRLASSSPDYATDIALQTPIQTRPLFLSSNANMFTPPVARRIYFDSPAEDPVYSDPLEPDEYELDLDYDKLDFRWEKFKPSGLNIADGATAVGSDEDDLDYADYAVDPMFRVTNSSPQDESSTTAVEPMVLPHKDIPNVPSDHVPRASPFAEQEGQVSITQPQAKEPLFVPSPPASRQHSPVAQAFAPAPGIYISPLRGENGEKEQSMTHRRPDATPSTRVPPDPINSMSTVEVKDEMTECDPPALPCTPVKQIMHSIPRTPEAPRHEPSTPMSVPRIAILPDSDDSEIEDPEAIPPRQQQLSQVSRDSIESWSAS